MQRTSHYVVAAALIAGAAFLSGQFVEGSGVFVTLSGSVAFTIFAYHRHARRHPRLP